MNYREHRAPAEWATMIECVWTNTGSVTEEVHDVLPDGAMDIIAAVHADGSVERAFVVGAMTRPLHTTVTNTDLIGIRFLPGAGGSALGANAAELRDETVDIQDVVRDSARLRDALRMLAARPNDAAVALRNIGSALGITGTLFPPDVRHATRLIAECPSSARIEHVASCVGISRQQLARRFAHHVGLSPKQFARICRVRAVLAATRFEFDGWSRAAADFGYVDQSHLIAEVREITGLTPAAWRAKTSSILPIGPVAVAPV